MILRLRSFVFLLCLLNGAASAEPYRARAQLTLAPASGQHCLRSAGQPALDCSVVEQARAAFAARVATMFTPVASASLELVLTITDANIVEQVTGWLRSLELRTTMRVLTSGGTLIDEIDSRGTATMTEETPISTAARVAAEAAAAEFDDRLYRSPAMRHYLIGRRIASPSELAPPRSDRLFWVALGSGLVQGGGDGGAGFGLNGQIGMSVRWIMLQAVYSRLHSSFQGTTRGFLFDSNLNTHDLGVETGVAIRLGPMVEMHAGPGLHWLFANADGSINIQGVGGASGSASRLTPTVFASVSVSVLPRRNGMRLVVSLEGRGYLATRVDLRDFNRGVPVANTTFGVFLGGEFPWGGGSR